MNDAEIASVALRVSKQSPERMKGLVDALRMVARNQVRGCFVECGVWMGASAIAARLVNPQMACRLYDTFAGMTEPTREDVSRKGGVAIEKYNRRKQSGDPWMSVSVDAVIENLKRHDVYDPRLIQMFIGDVAETLSDPANLPDSIALLRLDTDWYASTKIELETLYPRLSPGGVLIVDDYGYWQGARKATDEYFAPAPMEFTMLDSTAAMMVKPWRA